MVKYIKSHNFYQEGFPVDEIARRIRERIKTANEGGSYIQTKVEQLGLYLSKENNRLMF
jgi:hypothetical protein